MPVSRFVDDFFGASRQGVRCNGGWVISRLCKLLGFDTDEEKSEDFLGSMSVLGSRIQSIFEEGRVTSRIDEKKAQKWTILLTRILHEWKLDSEQSMKMAGRLGAAVTVSLDKVGRAFVKPFFAQAYDPRKWVTPQLHNASSWWIKFLTVRPPASFDIKGTRPTIRMWTDASGASRTLAAVVAVVCVRLV